MDPAILVSGPRSGPHDPCSLLVLAAGTLPGAAPLPPPVTGLVVCTPRTVAVNGGPPRPSVHPLVEALEQATPGSFVSLSPGDYEPLTIGLGNGAWNDADTSGGLPGLPIVVDGGGFARIRPGQGDSIGVYQKRRNGHITFRGLEIQASGLIAKRYHEAADRPAGARA